MEALCGLVPVQTYTGDYNGAEWPFQCREIANRPDAVTLHTDGTLSTNDPELQVRNNSVYCCPVGSFSNPLIPYKPCCVVGRVQ